MKLADLEKDVKAVEKTQQSVIAQIKQSEVTLACAIVCQKAAKFCD